MAVSAQHRVCWELLTPPRCHSWFKIKDKQFMEDVSPLGRIPVLYDGSSHMYESGMASTPVPGESCLHPAVSCFRKDSTQIQLNASSSYRGIAQDVDRHCTNLKYRCDDEETSRHIALQVPWWSICWKSTLMAHSVFPVAQLREPNTCRSA